MARNVRRTLQGQSGNVESLMSSQIHEVAMSD
jgi:hypothetical protein